MEGEAQLKTLVTRERGRGVRRCLIFRELELQQEMRMMKRRRRRRCDGAQLDFIVVIIIFHSFVHINKTNVI